MSRLQRSPVLPHVPRPSAWAGIFRAYSALLYCLTYPRPSAWAGMFRAFRAREAGLRWIVVPRDLKNG